MALPNNNITAGSAPLLWSNVKDALDKINDNFIALDLATGGTAVDLSILNTDVSPEYTDTYTLGTVTNQWKRVHSAGWTNTLTGTTNGLWAGEAQIKGYEAPVDEGYGPITKWIIDLPVGSTVNGNLIIDPDKTFIKTIQVDGNKSLESDVYGFTANFTSGLGIALNVTSASDEIEFAVDPTFNLNGSILADDTSVLVDRAGYIRGNVNTTGNWTATANGNVWTFASNGLLTFPNDATFGDTPNGATLFGGSQDLALQSNQNIKIVTDADAGIVTWTFSETGEFVVPGPIALEYGGIPTISISTTTTGGRVIGETNKTFNVVTTDGSTSREWIYGANGTLTFPGGQTISTTTYTGDVTGDLTGNVDGGNISADWFRVGTYNAAPTSSFFEIEGVGTPRVRMGGPGQQTLELRSYYSSPSVGDLGTTIDWRQSTTGTLDIILARLYSRVTNIGNTTEEGDLVITVAVAGSLSEVGYFNVDGFNGNVVGNLTGDVTGDVSGNAGTVTDGVYTSGSYSDPTWLTISKSFVGLGDVENTALSTWAGTSNITTVGTLDSLSVTNDVGAGSLTGNIFTNLIDSADSSAITVTPIMSFDADIIATADIRLGTSDSAIRGNTGIKLVPDNSLELSANIRLAITGDNSIEPRLTVDTPDGVDLMVGTGLAGISVSKIHSRVNLSAGNNAFIVRDNGSWWMTPLSAAPVSPTVGIYIADCTTWDPATKANGRPYPVWYDGATYNALY